MLCCKKDFLASSSTSFTNEITIRIIFKDKDRDQQKATNWRGGLTRGGFKPATFWSKENDLMFDHRLKSVGYQRCILTTLDELCTKPYDMRLFELVKFAQKILSNRFHLLQNHLFRCLSESRIRYTFCRLPFGINIYRNLTESHSARTFARRKLFLDNIS